MKITAGCLTVILVLIGITLFNGWLAMLAVGGSHSILQWPTHTINYLQGIFIGLILTFVGGFFKRIGK